MNNSFISQTKFLVVLGLTQLLLFSSCAREDFEWLINSPIKVTASAERPTTRSGANIQTSNFEEGQTINGYFKQSGGDAIGKTPTLLTTSAPEESGKNRLSPDVQPYYPSEGTVDIMALYPPTKATSTMTSFTVEADQTAAEDYKLSDLMWAGITNQSKTASDINLQFFHLMAKMTVTATGKEGVRVQKVSLINTIRTVPVTMSASGYSLSSVGTESDPTKKTILLASTTSEELDNQLSGSVLFPPQTIGGNFIEVETNYGKACYSVSNKEFKKGEAYSTDIVVKRQDIGFTTTITNWVNNDGSIAVPPGSSAGLKIAAIPDQPYNSFPKTPDLTITYTPNSELSQQLGDDPDNPHTYALVAGKDYRAEYFNNTNQGTAMVIITGLKSPDRTGVEEVLADILAQIKSMTSFEITAATGNIAYPSTTKEVEYEYNTTVDHPLEKNGGDGRFTYTSSVEEVADVTVSGIVTIRKVGTTRITANMDNTGNYSAATAYYDLTVKPRSLKDAKTRGDLTITMATTTFPYTGQPYTPAVVVKDKGRTLQEKVHYNYSVDDNTAAGTATITITGKGNYSSDHNDDATTTFTITKQQPTITMDTTPAKMAKGFTFTRIGTSSFSNATVRYSTSDASGTYVTIDSNTGVVTAKAVTTSPVTIYAHIDADNSSDGGWEAATPVSYQLSVVESEWTYSYTGNVQQWSCPLTGNYQLEALGGQGAQSGSFYGGRGAHVGGRVNINEGDVLYLYVGQGGTRVQSKQTQGAWNGGGYYTGNNTTSDTERYFAGGGGATDISLATGDSGSNGSNWNTNQHLYSRIIVAGGGGGALYRSVSGTNYGGGGGNGGAYIGEAGYGGSYPGGGGTLTAGGAVASGGYAYSGGFGIGGNFEGTYSSGLGGGGWYGGAAGRSDNTINVQGAGGGGSSYIYSIENAGSYPNPPSGITKPDTRWYITPTILAEGGNAQLNGEVRIKYMGPTE